VAAISFHTLPLLLLFFSEDILPCMRHLDQTLQIATTIVATIAKHHARRVLLSIAASSDAPKYYISPCIRAQQEREWTDER